MVNLNAKFVTYTTVAVILMLDVKICGQLKTALFTARKISQPQFPQKIRIETFQNQKA